MFPVPERLSAVGEFQQQEQSKQLEEQLQCVPCSRETERSGGMPAIKNRASSWKSSEEKLSVQPKGIEKLVA